jgi:hypothetical protein
MSVKPRRERIEIPPVDEERKDGDRSGEPVGGTYFPGEPRTKMQVTKNGKTSKLGEGGGIGPSLQDVQRSISREPADANKKTPDIKHSMNST